MSISPLFDAHLLNDDGIAKARWLARDFDTLLRLIEDRVELEPGGGVGSRELAVCRTHLEAACFYAKKAMAMQPRNQKTGAPPVTT